MASESTELHILAWFILISGFTTNGFICAAFVLCHRLQTVTNYFVVNLAVSGIISFLDLTAWELITLADMGTDDVYLFMQSWDIFAACLSAASVTAIAFDRYFAVSRPLRYSTCITHKKALLALSGVWTYAFIIAPMTWFRKLDASQTYATIYSIILTLYNFVVALVLCLFCYISIVLFAWPHLRQNSALRHYAPDSRGFALAKHLKITFTILVLSAPLMLGWSVFYVITIAEQFYPVQIVSSTVHLFISMLATLIAAINPVIYIFLTKDFRDVATSWICGRRYQSRSEQLTTMQSFPPVYQPTSTLEDSNEQSKLGYLPEVLIRLSWMSTVGASDEKNLWYPGYLATKHIPKIKHMRATSTWSS